MAANEPHATQAFPNPPAIYYRQYTDENVKSGLAPKPPPVVQGPYQMFGAPFDVSKLYKGMYLTFWTFRQTIPWLEIWKIRVYNVSIH